MTEKELFKNAMKQNMKNPADQTAAEVQESKRNYGYVKTPVMKYAAAAAVLALAVGVGTALVLNGSKTVPKTAGEISQAESIASAPESVSSTEQAVSTEEQTAMEVYRGFWSEVKAAPENYWSSVQVLNTDVYTTEPMSTRSYWFTEDQFGQTKSGKRLSEEMADFFASAENVEYLGFTSDNGDPPSELMDILASESITPGKVITLSPKAEVEQSGLSAIFMNYQIGETGVIISLITVSNTTDTGEVVHRDDYFRVTSADWDYPCYENDSFVIPDWNTSTSNQAYTLSENEMRAEDMDHSFRVTDAEDRISFGFSFSLDDSRSVMPVVNISGFTLPEGVNITEGQFRIHLDKADEYGKSSAVDYPVAMTEDIVTNGVTVDLKDFAQELSKDEIAAIRVDAFFNTNEHTKAVYEEYEGNSSDLRYAYRIGNYAGIDRSK